jgi:hypothetical protein
MTNRWITLLVLTIALVLACTVSGSASAPIAPGGGWVQVGPTAMGDRGNVGFSALAPYGGSLYAGSTYEGDGGAQLWQFSAGVWTAVSRDGLGNTDNYGINTLAEFHSQLYAGTWNEKAGGEIWRSRDGHAWGRVVSGGLGDPNSAEVMHLTVFDNKLYACTASYTTTHGAEVWRSGTGDAGSWAKVVTNGFGDAANGLIVTLKVHSSYLYASTMNPAGGEVWRTRTGNTGDWKMVNGNGFGDSGNAMITSMTSYDNYLYAGTHNAAGAGAQIWRCRTCDGTDWSKVVATGWGNPQNTRTPNLIVYDSKLYGIVGNQVTGAEAWRTVNGTNWEHIGAGGLGNPSNRSAYYDSSSAVFDNRLYVGLTNFANGGAVYLYPADRVVLPWVVK